jgi:hypothetical protein
VHSSKYQFSTFATIFLVVVDSLKHSFFFLNKINMGNEFIANECIIFCVPFFPYYVEVNVNKELYNMPTQIHVGEDISRIDHIKQVRGHVESGCFPFFWHLSLLYTNAQFLGNYFSPVQVASKDCHCVFQGDPFFRKLGAVLLSIQSVDESHQVDVWLPQVDYPILAIAPVCKLLVFLSP